MADKIQIYAGIKSKMPQLLHRELGYCTDTKELFIGGSDGEGNLLIGSVEWANDISALKTANESLGQSITEVKQSLSGKLSASSATSVPELATDAVLTDVVSGFNTLINSLKAAGIMKT